LSEQTVIIEKNLISNGLNATKFYVLYRTTCFDLSRVVFRFTIGL